MFAEKQLYLDRDPSKHPLPEDITSDDKTFSFQGKVQSKKMKQMKTEM